MFFSARAVATDVPVLLLNQPIFKRKASTRVLKPCNTNVAVSAQLEAKHITSDYRPLRLEKVSPNPKFFTCVVILDYSFGLNMPTHLTKTAIFVFVYANEAMT